jgi:hypothetical protein
MRCDKTLSWEAAASRDLFGTTRRKKPRTHCVSSLAPGLLQTAFWVTRDET